MATTHSTTVESEVTAREVFTLRVYGTQGFLLLSPDLMEYDSYADALHAGLQEMAANPDVAKFAIDKTYRRHVESAECCAMEEPRVAVGPLHRDTLEYVR